MDKLLGRRRKAPNTEDGRLPPSGSNGVGEQEKHFHIDPNRKTIINHNGHKVTRGIQPIGESGRKGIHPVHFPKICWRSASKVSMIVNVLWPFVPAAFAVRYARPDDHVTIFALNYIAMVPTANLIGFAGQELARKVPKVFGVILEIFLGGIVEIVLFMVLLHKSVGGDLIPVIRAAILGSILANLLLCLGSCFFIGGMRSGREEQQFSDVISEAGSGVLLMAGFGLLIPSAFYVSIKGTHPEEELLASVLHISQITAVILLFAFLLYVWFQLRTHHGLFDDVLGQDEQKDHDRHKDLKKAKLTLTECVTALIVAITLVSFIAVFLVDQIHHIVEISHISDSFLGLILVPVVEKFAENLTAVDEAWDNQMNFAISHVLGATIQTALFNSSLVVLVGWGLNKGMDLNFAAFNVIVLILAVIVVGNFLRDQKSNYLEGALCILIYMLIAIAAWYYPNPSHGSEAAAEGSGGEVVAAPHRLVRMMAR